MGIIRIIRVIKSILAGFALYNFFMYFKYHEDRYLYTELTMVFIIGLLESVE